MILTPNSARDSCIPSLVNDVMRLCEKADFALVTTQGPSFIDEYSLRPENHLLDLVQAVESWDDDGVDSVIKQLARNRHVDAEAIERLKQWDVEGKISGYYWVQIKKRLDDIPRIQEKKEARAIGFIQNQRVT